jgi:hypothetical protein
LVKGTNLGADVTWKGTRQATLPGGLRTGAPGKHVIGGKAKYRLLDEKVRVFVAPPVEEINQAVVRLQISVLLVMGPDLFLVTPTAPAICLVKSQAHGWRESPTVIRETPSRRSYTRTFPQGRYENQRKLAKCSNSLGLDHHSSSVFFIT